MNQLVTEEKLFSTQPPCEFLSRDNPTFQMVIPCFYKDIHSRSAALVLRRDAGELQRFDIDHSWKYSVLPATASVACIGSCKIDFDGIREESFMLRFPTPLLLNTFFVAFNACINFAELDTEEKLESRIEYQIGQVPVRSRDAPGGYSTHMNENAAFQLMVDVDFGPKQNYIIVPKHDIIGNFTARLNVRVTTHQYEKFFHQYASAEGLKMHWRQVPGVSNPPPVSSHPQGDPILQLDQYAFEPTCTRPPRAQFIPPGAILPNAHANADPPV